jgi:hypothetical protein
MSTRLLLLQGGCVQLKNEQRPHCKCHYGFSGDTCGDLDMEAGKLFTCWNNCQVRQGQDIIASRPGTQE